MSNVTTSGLKCRACGRELQQVSELPYFDLEGSPKVARVNGFQCTQCRGGLEDGLGYPVRIPLPEGTIIHGVRGNCSYCGLALKSTPGTSCVSSTGKISHVPYFGADCYVCGRLTGGDRKLAIKDAAFIELLQIPCEIRRLWLIDPTNLLESGLTTIEAKVAHIVYSPVTKELALGDQMHSCEYLAGMYITGYQAQGYVACQVDKDGILKLFTGGPTWWLDETYFVLRRLGVPADRLRVSAKDSIHTL